MKKFLEILVLGSILIKPAFAACIGVSVDPAGTHAHNNAITIPLNSIFIRLAHPMVQ